MKSSGFFLQISELFPLGIITFTLLLILVSCTPTQQNGKRSSEPHNIPLSQKNKHLSTPHTQLLDFYKKWRGTPHKLGGGSKRGIDCSALVQMAYREVYSHTLPRSTKDQQHAGIRINRNQLHSGDLVFFKTGFFGRHVGIYLADSTFFHSSKSKGVMVSSLDEKYWASKYWKSIRIPKKR